MGAPFFRIELLPARHGDCLWIEYGNDRDTHRLLIDGGPVSTYPYLQKRIDRMPPGDKTFELVVLTHVDADHVEGLVRLFADKPLPFAVDEVWFNGWRQMKQAHGLLGALQGEFLSALLANRVPRAWKAEAPAWVIGNQGPLPTRKLAGGMQLTLLSPDPAKLAKMVKEWKAAVSESGIRPGDLEAAWRALAKKKQFLPKQGLLGTAPDLDKLLRAQFKPDQAVANGSSIALLAEYSDKSALLLGDAHPDVVARSLERLCKARGVSKLAVDAVKVAHHGSKANTNSALLQRVASPAYVISTNGDQFKHPDAPCIARILRDGRPKRLYFNYKSTYTKPWLAAAAQKKHGYDAVVRDDADLSLIVVL